jgi:hypothetical protein
MARNPLDTEVEGFNQVLWIIWIISFYIVAYLCSKIFFIRKPSSMARNARRAEGRYQAAAQGEGSDRSRTPSHLVW